MRQRPCQREKSRRVCGFKKDGFVSAFVDELKKRQTRFSDKSHL